MIVSFKNKSLKAFFLKGEASKLNPQHLKKLRLALAKLHAATAIKDISLPGSELHPLSGDLAGYWAISISGNWRLIFKFQEGEVSALDYVDYH